MKDITKKLNGLGLWVALLLMSALLSNGADHTFTIGDTNFLLDGKPFQIKAGEMHPARVPHEYWADRLRMMHAMGLNTVSIYVFLEPTGTARGEIQFQR